MKKLKWGLIGCGDIARKRVAPALRDLESCELYAVNRKNPGLAESFAAEFGAKKWYASWRDLLSDPEIDAVYIAAPVYLHAPVAVGAAEAGKHVLCEKPMALNNGECDLMIESCMENNVKLGIAYYRHFYPAVEKIKEIIAGGGIGQVVHCQMNAFEYFNPQPGEPRYWLMEKEKSGGGPMFDFGCHRIEVLINLFGKIKRVEGFLANVRFNREVEDTAAALFKFESGPVAALNVSHAANEPQDTLDIFGSKGSIRVPVLNNGTIIIKTGSGESEIKCPPEKNFHMPLIKDFSESILSGRLPVVRGENGREVNNILSLIYAGK